MDDDFSWSDAPKAAYEAYCAKRWPDIRARPWATLMQLEKQAWAEAVWAGVAARNREENDE